MKRTVETHPRSGSSPIRRYTPPSLLCNRLRDSAIIRTALSSSRRSPTPEYNCKYNATDTRACYTMILVRSPNDSTPALSYVLHATCSRVGECERSKRGNTTRLSKVRTTHMGSTHNSINRPMHYAVSSWVERLAWWVTREHPAPTSAWGTSSLRSTCTRGNTAQQRTGGQDA